MMTSFSRALIVHLDFENFGGAEMYCMRVANVLQRRFDVVEIVHFGASPDFKFIESFTNIQLNREIVKFVSLPLPFVLQKLLIGTRKKLVVVKQAIMVRAARKIARNYDFAVTTFAETPLPKIRMIQSIHIPIMSANKDIMAYSGLADITPLRRLRHALYLRAVWMLMGGGKKRVAQQYTVTNSEWTKQQFLKVYPGSNAYAIHSGVQVDFTPASPEWIPFHDRKNNLVLLGRIAPSKHIDVAIEIAEGLRRRGHNVGLDIIGNVSASYQQVFLRLLSGRTWIRVHSGLDRDEVEKLILQQKWGLHGYRFEHYGLAPAELQALGCITFIHDSGGQREIICNPQQRYTDSADAIAKIDAAMRSQELQQTLLCDGRSSAAKHTIIAFERAFDRLVDQVMDDSSL